ncbi:ankyrin repeat protein [Zalerion maritima]|uniref:Ankyrin repeat protein n=1 Tax=Zalerion maritima TaxID=339359 RepID=A0AAD5RYW5_9PEZI|nr:ankyrin repeat protein [Zalerion maritima]
MEPKIQLFGCDASFAEETRHPDTRYTLSSDPPKAVFGVGQGRHPNVEDIVKEPLAGARSMCVFGSDLVLGWDGRSTPAYDLGCFPEGCFGASGSNVLLDEARGRQTLKVLVYRRHKFGRVPHH